MSTVYLTPWNGSEGEQRREERKRSDWLNWGRERTTARWPELTESCREKEWKRKQNKREYFCMNEPDYPLLDIHIAGFWSHLKPFKTETSPVLFSTIHLKPYSISMTWRLRVRGALWEITKLPCKLENTTSNVDKVLLSCSHQKENQLEKG